MQPAAALSGGRLIPFSSEPRSVLSHNGRSIASFDIGGPNLDEEIVGSFGSEWKRFDWFSDAAIEIAGGECFDIIPPELFVTVGHAHDAGCGSGRWSRCLSARGGFVESIDPSEAVPSASERNRDRPNVRVSRASIDNVPFADASVERRYTREEFVGILKTAGLEDIVVSPWVPFWHALGRRAL